MKSADFTDRDDLLNWRKCKSTNMGNERAQMKGCGSFEQMSLVRAKVDTQ